MDKKTQELIAIGAAVTANCVPCFKFHFAKAREELASDDEVREAVRVGRMVGAAKTWDDEIGKIFA
jgi:AhpD family alkylhydroperoxidase